MCDLLPSEVRFRPLSSRLVHVMEMIDMSSVREFGLKNDILEGNPRYKFVSNVFGLWFSFFLSFLPRSYIGEN